MAQMFNPLLPQKDEELERARQYAQMTQAQRAAMDARLMENQAVEGAENIGRGVLGLPPSEATNRGAAANEIRALARATTPGTPEFYKAAAAIFQKHGLAAEAERMTQQLHDVEFGKGESQDVLKMQLVRDYLKRRFDAGDISVKPAIDAIDRELRTYGQRGTPPADPEFVKLLNEYEKAVAAGQGDRAEAIKKALDAYIAQKERSGGNADDIRRQRLELDREKFGEDKRKTAEKETGAKRQMVGQIQSVARMLNEQVQAAEALHSHPGLARITGRIVGLGGRVAAALTDMGADAAAYMRTIQAQAFLAALSELRTTSKSGTTGLGQLTEREGDKVQAAKAALDSQQTTEQFQGNLERYVASLRSLRAALAQDIVSFDEAAALPPELEKIVHRKPVKAIAPSASPGPAPAVDKPKRTFKATKVE